MDGRDPNPNLNPNQSEAKQRRYVSLPPSEKKDLRLGRKKNPGLRRWNPGKVPPQVLGFRSRSTYSVRVCLCDFLMKLASRCLLLAT